MSACACVLKEHVEKYLTVRSHFSLRTVALRSGVPYSTVWRIYQGGTTLIDFGTAISLINIVANKEEAGRFLSEHFPEKVKAVNEIYEYHRQGLPSDTYREHLSRYIPNRVFSFAATREGTTREKIHRVTGEDGLQALEELLALEILVEAEDGRITYPHGDFSLSNPTDFIDYFMMKLHAFDKSLLGTAGAILGSVMESVNERAMESIKGELAKTHRNINRIISDESSAGPLPVFAGIVMCLMDKSEFSAQVGRMAQ